jgi:2-keto-3-deoxy-6-phosphogluconate aldolase
MKKIAAFLGMGSKLVPKDLAAAGDFGAMRDNGAQVLAWIQEVRD